MSFLKRFFENAVHDRVPEQRTIKEKGKTTPVFYGTVPPYPNFNASQDAAALKSAIETKGVNEDVIISVLTKRNNEQRQMIKSAYEAVAGVSLNRALKSALKSHLEEISLALLMTPAHFDAHLLKEATKGLGTNEDVLVEVLATRTNEQIRELKKAFKTNYKKDLEDVIKAETRGDFTTALLAMLKANKDENTDVNTDQAQKDAKTLFESGENTKGVKVSAFIDILTSRSGPQLSKTFQMYSAVSDKTLPKALEMELKGDIEDCLIDVVKCAWSTPAFFAEKLHRAMARQGTSEDTLIRVLVSRSEIDLKKIMEEYKAMYKTTLQEDILKDTKKHFESILLGLCGPH